MKKRCLILAGLLFTAQVLSTAVVIAEDADSAVMEELAKDTIDVIEVVEDAEAAEEEEPAEETEEETAEAEEAAEEPEAPAVRPEYDFHDYLKELGEYKGLVAEVSALEEITEEILKEEINYRMSDVTEDVTEGTVEEGDVANIDYVGKKDDVAFDGGTAAGYDLTIGSGTFIPGFEEGLVGVKIGDTVDLNLTFPEQYHSADLAGAEVVFTVTVNSVKRPMEYSDAAVEKLTEGEHKDMASYEAAVKEEMENTNIQNQKTEAENIFWEKVMETSVFEGVPEEVVEYDVNANIEYNRTMLLYYYGVTLEDYLAMQGKTLEQVKENTRTTMETSLKYEMLEQAILEAEGTELSEEIFNEYAEKYAEQYEIDVETFLARTGEDTLWRNIRYEKSAEILLANNTFTEIAAE